MERVISLFTYFCQLLSCPTVKKITLLLLVLLYCNMALKKAAIFLP